MYHNWWLKTIRLVLIFKIKSMGQIKVELNGPTLMLSVKSVLQVNIDFWTIKSSVFVLNRKISIP